MISLFRFRRSSNRRRRTLGRKADPGVPLRRRALPRAVRTLIRSGINNFGRLGTPVSKTHEVLTTAFSAAIRTIMSPLESLVTITVEDTSIRIVISRGYRVSSWHEAELPSGVVSGGQILNHEKFEECLFEAFEAMAHGFRIGDRRLAVAIGGRNHVHRRFSLFVPRKVRLERAVAETLKSDLNVIGDDMLLDWETEGTREITEDELVTISHQMSTDESNVPDGAIYTVYSAGLRRGVVENNLEPLSLISNRIAGVQPKTLALGAAVNELSSIIVDIEARSFNVIVLKNGLPEVVRESSFAPNEDTEVLSVSIKGHITRAVAYLNSLDPNDQLDDEMPLFLTGAGSANPKLVAMLGRELPFKFKPLPKTLRAPEQFPFNRFASNVGLALVSGKRFWQLTRVPVVNNANFDLRPQQYKPKPLPIKAAMKTVAAAVFVVGLVSATMYTRERQEGLEDTRVAIETLQNYESALAERSAELRAINKETSQIVAQSEAYESATGKLSAIDRSHSKYVELTFLDSPSGISVRQYEDTGERLSFILTGNDHEEVLLFVEALTDSPMFRSVHLDRVNLPMDGPSEEDGIQSQVQAVIVAERAASTAAIAVEESQTLNEG